jgi:WD40 repeat protein
VRYFLPIVVSASELTVIVVSVSDDKSMRLWTVDDASNANASAATRRYPKWVQSHVLEDYHTRTIFSVSWSRHHGLIASVGADNTLRITREVNGILEHVFEHSLGNEDGSELNAVAWCPIAEHAALLATSGDDGRIRIWKWKGV